MIYLNHKIYQMHLTNYDFKKKYWSRWDLLLSSFDWSIENLSKRLIRGYQMWAGKAIILDAVNSFHQYHLTVFFFPMAFYFTIHFCNSICTWSLYIFLLFIFSFFYLIYNYLCNQCLSPPKLWVRIILMARCIRYITCIW
jgi:hypothetical protein